VFHFFFASQAGLLFSFPLLLLSPWVSLFPFYGAGPGNSAFSFVRYTLMRSFFFSPFHLSRVIALPLFLPPRFLEWFIFLLGRSFSSFLPLLIFPPREYYASFFFRLEPRVSFVYLLQPSIFFFPPQNVLTISTDPASFTTVQFTSFWVPPADPQISFPPPFFPFTQHVTDLFNCCAKRTPRSRSSLTTSPFSLFSLPPRSRSARTLGGVGQVWSSSPGETDYNLVIGRGPFIHFLPPPPQPLLMGSSGLFFPRGTGGAPFFFDLVIRTPLPLSLFPLPPRSTRPFAASSPKRPPTFSAQPPFSSFSFGATASPLDGFPDGQITQDPHGQLVWKILPPFSPFFSRGHDSFFSHWAVLPHRCDACWLP